MKPIILAPNQPAQFYRGGDAIASFRGVAAAGEFGPEDWLASTVSLFGSSAGLSRLPDGTLLRDAISAEPLIYLGPAHHAAFGTDPALLVKLLDAGERLPVHVHPDQAFAARHLGCRHGKTEAWIVLGVSGDDPAVYVGFREPISPSTLSAWIKKEDAAMLAAMNRLPVAVGDTVLIPAGTPHAIGEGVFVVELQEPTDFSVMLEWASFGLPDRATEQLGLPAAVALTCVDSSAWDAARLALCVTRGALSDGPGIRRLLPQAADRFFYAEQIVVRSSVELTAQFAVLVVESGRGRIECVDGGIAIERGHTVLLPYAAGDLRITGDVCLIRCLPPLLG